MIVVKKYTLFRHCNMQLLQVSMQLFCDEYDVYSIPKNERVTGLLLCTRLVPLPNAGNAPFCLLLEAAMSSFSNL